MPQRIPGAWWILVGGPWRGGGRALGVVRAGRPGRRPARGAGQANAAGGDLRACDPFLAAFAHQAAKPGA